MADAPSTSSHEDVELDPDNEGWTTVQGRKHRADKTSGNGSHTASQTTTSTNMTRLNKLKVVATHGFETPYHLVAAIQQEKPSLRFQARPNLKGEFLLTAPDRETYEELKNLTTVNDKQVRLVPLEPDSKVIKAVVLRYPLQMPLAPLESCANVLKAERCKISTGAETMQIVISYQGQLPGKLDLGIWGAYYTRPYSPEPLRCYRCQKYGHHQARCTGRAVCGICSGSHDTAACIKKHKEGTATSAKCPNCQGQHHVWNRACPTRTEIISTNLEKQEAWKKAHRPAPQGTFQWGRQSTSSTATQHAAMDEREFPTLASATRPVQSPQPPPAETAAPHQPAPQTPKQPRTRQQTKAAKQRQVQEKQPQTKQDKVQVEQQPMKKQPQNTQEQKKQQPVEETQEGDTETGTHAQAIVYLDNLLSKFTEILTTIMDKRVDPRLATRAREQVLSLFDLSPKTPLAGNPAPQDEDAADWTEEPETDQQVKNKTTPTTAPPTTTEKATSESSNGTSAVPGTSTTS